MVSLHVPGTPVQQGSMIPRLIWVGGKPKATMHSHNSAGLKAWRKAIVDRIRALQHPTIGPYVAVEATFYMPKPGRTKYPEYPAGTPDLDKLTRAVLDALTESGLIEDDARVVRLGIEEEWASAEHPAGVVLHVHPR